VVYALNHAIRVMMCHRELHFSFYVLTRSTNIALYGVHSGFSLVVNDWLTPRIYELQFLTRHTLAKVLLPRFLLPLIKLQLPIECYLGIVIAMHPEHWLTYEVVASFALRYVMTAKCHRYLDSLHYMRIALKMQIECRKLKVNRKITELHLSIQKSMTKTYAISDCLIYSFCLP
jgi:hypothetical protein